MSAHLSADEVSSLRTPQVKMGSIRPFASTVRRKRRNCDGSSKLLRPVSVQTVLSCTSLSAHLIADWAWDVVHDPSSEFWAWDVVFPASSTQSDVLGSNVLLWSLNWFIKEPLDEKFVSYHQDATYWGLEPHDVVTAWVALSDASEDRLGPPDP